jgi:hypothetical protein
MTASRILFTDLCPQHKKQPLFLKLKKLFKLYPTMTTKEFAFLNNIQKEEALVLLEKIKAGTIN